MSVLRFLDRLVAGLFIACLNIWHRAFAPALGVQCRFEPSCSRYAVEALKRHGCLKGSIIALKRVIRCSPRFEGGSDPVPD